MRTPIGRIEIVLGGQDAGDARSARSAARASSASRNYLSLDARVPLDFEGMAEGHRVDGLPPRESVNKLSGVR
ncbi:MAG: hypothetical protein WKG07_46340 [Hymenobacter sp.]